MIPANKSQAVEATIVIPSLDANERLVKLIKALRDESQRTILIVNDGSDRSYDAIYQNALSYDNVHLLRFRENKGKGAALKAAFRWHRRHFPQSAGVVTADSDGQHDPKDIAKLCRILEENHQKQELVPPLILGVRNFERAAVPFKSYYGNKITSFVFKSVSGRVLHDTQTGLRGVPQRYLTDFLEIEGERFDYEMNMLLKSCEWEIPFWEESIQTIYIGDNEHSHFRPVHDSYLIYRPIALFAFASLFSAMLDIVCFILLYQWIGGKFSSRLLLATVSARFLSGVFNFWLNKRFVFKSEAPKEREGAKYFTLFLSQLLCSYLLTLLVTQLVGGVYLIKVLVDIFLFCLSYIIQRRWVFAQKKVRTS